MSRLIGQKIYGLVIGYNASIWNENNANVYSAITGGAHGNGRSWVRLGIDNGVWFSITGGQHSVFVYNIAYSLTAQQPFYIRQVWKGRHIRQSGEPGETEERYYHSDIQEPCWIE